MAKATKKKAAAKKAPAKRTRAAKPTKDETVEVHTMSFLQGNMPPIRDIMYHLDTIKGLEERAATARGKVAEAKKKAKEAGIDLAAISMAMGFERMDPLEMATRLRQTQAILSERGSPIQINLFETKFGSIEEQAASEGWNDGRACRHANVERWKEGIPGHKEYMRRWNDGQVEAGKDGPLKGADQADEE